ncbi:MAG TPA: hypothetical protein V6C97_01005 [Oculatellaceae cyanobacterium]
MRVCESVCVCVLCASHPVDLTYGNMLDVCVCVCGERERERERERE